MTAAANRQTGTIKDINTERGFGFIEPQTDGRKAKDVFFHFTGLVEGVEFNSLQKGQAVSFEVETTPKGPRAERIARA